MKNFSLSFLLLFTLSFSQTFAQNIIFDIFQRQDLTYDQILDATKKVIEESKDSVERKKLTKHFERWKFEQKFHLDDKRNIISKEIEDREFRLKAKRVPFASTPAWTELGPKSFTYTSGWNPGVGRVTSVAVHPTNSQIIYVSSPGGGIWKTTNGGTNWTPLVDATSTYMNVYNLCIDPSNTNTIYAALTSGGVIKSTDAGATWANTGNGPFNTKKVIVHPTNSNIVLATSSSGIHYSSNGGTSWTSVLTGVSKEDIEFKPGDPSIVYCSGSSSIFHRSTDGGLTWNQVSIANGITNTGRTLIGVSAASVDVVYLVQANGSSFGRLYKSTDSGQNFTTTVVGDFNAGTNYFGYTGSTAGGQATYDMAIAVNPQDINDLVIAGIIVWRSTDGGTSFTQRTIWSYPNALGYNHADVHALEYVGNTLYSGSDGGIYKSTNNGVAWTDLSTGLGIRQLYRIANSSLDANVMAGGAQDNGTMARQTGGNFVDWLGADGMDVIINPTNALEMIGTSQYGDIYRTTNGGNSRSGLTKPADGNWVTPLAWHPTNGTIVYGGWDSVYKSTDGGNTWTNIATTITSPGNFDDLAVAPSNDQYIYASKGNVLWVTTNGGTTWTSYNYPAAISDIAVKYNDPAKVWITTTSTSQPIVLSTNAGATYTNISAGLPSLAGRSVAVDDNLSEGVYVGMNLGVYYKDLNNPSWVLFGTGLPSVAINEVEISKPAKKLRVATYGRGVWEAPLLNCPLTLAFGPDPQTAGTYQAIDTITSQANVATGTIYNAGKSITLSPPFSAGSNEVFLARIQACSY